MATLYDAENRVKLYRKYALVRLCAATVKMVEV